MKKLLVLLTLLGLILIPAISTAAAVNVYLDSMGGQGNYEGKVLGNEMIDEDLALTFVGVEVCTEKWKVGLEHGWGEYADFDYRLNDLKLGYKIIETDNFKTDLTVSYVKIDDSDSIAGKVNGWSIGADLIYNFGDQLNAELDLAYAVDGDSDDSFFTPVVDDVKVSSVKLKLNYLFTDNWGAYLGYRYRSVALKNDSLKLLEVTTSGAVLGINYRF